jgi:hypothetical protein
LVFKGLVISAIFALAFAVACSQQDGTSTMVVPEDTAVPSPEVSTPANGQTTLDPIPTNEAIFRPTEAPVAQAPAPNPPRGGFVPLDDPIFLAANDTDYFGDEELVLGVEFAGEVRAYPVRMLRYHHVVNDTVGGEPLLVTY